MKQKIILIGAVALIAAFAYRCHSRGHWAITNAPPSRPGIVCIGDSLTVGLGVTPGEAYPALLPGLLGMRAEQVISAGVSGRTIPEALRDVRRDGVPPDAGAAVILLGGNDQLRQLSIEASLSDLEGLIELLQREGRMVVVCDFSPVPALHRAWAKGFEEIARRRGCILVKGVADELYTGSNDYQASDGIHLSARGQRAVAERIADALRPHLRGGG